MAGKYGTEQKKIELAAHPPVDYNSYRSLPGVRQLPAKHDVCPTPQITEPSDQLEVSVGELNSLYMADEATADAMFRGKRLILYEVPVEEVEETLQIDRHGDIVVSKEYFTFGGIRFYPNDLAKMQQVEVGFVLNVVGDCRGVHMGSVIIDNSWLEGVGVDLGGGSLPVPY